MKNIHALMISLFSVVLITANVFAQERDVKPNLNDQIKIEKQIKEAKAAHRAEISGKTEAVSAPTEATQKGMYLKKVPGDYVREVTPNPAKPSVTPTDDTWDLQFSLDLETVTGALGNAGAECDGSYYYSTRWATNLIHKYDFDGNLIEEFSISGVSGLRDLAFDGTYMYGGAAANTIFEMDFSTQTLISTISSPQIVRSIAYDVAEDALWCSNWDTDITLVSKAGVALNSIPAATHGLGGIYGTAYDDWTDGGPYLWIFDQGAGAGTAQIIYQADLNTITMTGFSYDVMNDLGPNAQAIAGGLFTVPDVYTGTVSLGGLLQGTPDMLFMYELAISGPLPDNDLGVSSIVAPTTGSGLTANESVTVTIKNYGTAPQSNFDVYFTLDGGAPVTETYSGTLNGGETVDHTFATTVDLSTPGDYEFMACTDLAGDENADNDCKTKTVTHLTQFVAYPMSEDYWTGTTDGTVKTEISYVKSWGAPTGSLGENGWMKFDVSDLPGNVIINWIKFHGYVTNTNFPYWSVTPMSIDPVTASASDIWNMASAGAPTDVAYAFNNESSTFAPGWKEYDLVNGAPDDLANALANGQDWFAIGIFERDVSATYYLEFDGWNETNVPYLEIDYTELDFGSIEGTVTELASGNPIDGASIVAEGPDFTYNVTTMSDGTYSIDPAQVGSYTIYCTMDGYNDMMASGVMVAAGSTATQDFAMTSPTMEVDPLEISKTMDPNTTGTEMVDVTNNGDGPLDWSASIEFLNDNSDDAWDLQFEFDVTAASGGPGNAGAECDGEYYYTTRWASNLIHKYDFDGNMIEEFSIPGVSGLRDLAYDGTYFYGGAAANTIFQMDFGSQTLVSSISSSQPVRSIAYDNSEDALWVANWDTDIDLVDMSGAVINSLPAATHGLGGMYGTAFDNVSDGTPYLWIFDQGAGAGTPQYIYQADLSTMTMTGFSYDVTQDLVPNTDAIAGGLFLVDNVYSGTWSIGGLIQGVPDDFFMYELAASNPLWLTLDQNSGTVDPGNTVPVTLNFNSTGLLAGEIYNANVHFTSDPDVGSETVEVELIVGDLVPGHITGNVMLSGSAPYNMGDVTQVLVEAGAYFDYPDASGDYDITAYPGTYDVTSTLYGYETQTASGVVVPEGGLVENVDFDMPTTYGRIMGTVTDIDTGDPIEDATVSVEGTSFETMTAADGTYEIFIAEGTYDVTADHPTYIMETMNGVAVTAENDTEVNFQLTYQCDFCAASGGDDEWIDGIELGTISNLGTGYSAAGYADYTSMSTIVLPGMQYTITIHTGNFYTSDDYAVWIDWNQDCTFDPTTENVVCEFDVGAEVNNFDFTVPPTATEGAATMRVRLKWSGSDCGDPCGTTTYGEVEDYTVIVAPGEFGELDGTVTELATGDPIENAHINVGNGLYETDTDGDGYYYFEEIFVGDWDVSCTADGYNPQTASVTINENELTTQDFQMTAPTLEVDPMSVEMTLEPNETGQDFLDIANNGDGPVDWSAAVEFIGDNSDDAWDLQFSFDVTAASGAAGNAGAECDGQYYYSTRWASNLIHKYDLSGNLIEEFSVAGATGLRDLAFDGTYFYGGAAANTIFQMDFETQTLVSSISASQPVRSIAFDDTEDALWISNWDTDIDLVDMSGAVINTLPASVHGLGGIYGTAFENVSDGTSYLWIFDQGAGAGTAQYIYQANVDNLTMTGFSYDVMQDLAADPNAIAGGLFVVDNVYSGVWSIGGLKQGVPDEIFMYELAPSEAWLVISPTSGMLDPDENTQMTLDFDATGMLPGDYFANIQFASDPDVGSPSVDVTLHVEGLVPVVNLMMDWECTDVMMTWEMPAGGDPDSWNIYRDGDPIGSSTVMEYTDEMVDPGVDYVYTITAVYGGDESQPCPPETMNVPVPEDMEVADLDGYQTSPGIHTAELFWTQPACCVAPDGYNIYRDGEQINSVLVTETQYNDEGVPFGFYEYSVKAVYYWGESDFSNAAYVLLVGVEELNAEQFELFPNPANESFKVSADFMIDEYELLNNVGQVVAKEKTNATSFRVDVAGFESGIYYIKLFTENGMILRKIAVE